MSKIVLNNHEPRPDKVWDWDEPSYVLPPTGKSVKTWVGQKEVEEQLGEVREPEVFETEHHVYSVPFHYRNVELTYWSENEDKGHEFLGELGTITITEEMPIVEVVVVGSGCSGNNYNTIEWWNEGESIRNAKGQLIKRQRVDGLKGQHPAWIQKAMTQDPPDFESVDEAKTYIMTMQRVIHGMTSNYTQPGSLMTGLFENTVHFRIGDTSKPDMNVHKIKIRGGGLDYEDPFNHRNRYPADYVFRLIDVIVKKPNKQAEGES